MFATVEEISDDLAKAPNGRWNPEEAAKLIDMLIPLPNKEGHTLSVGGYYTCRHLNTETGDCMNYEGRPDMCRDYPYGEACTFKECTSEQARNPPAREGSTKLKVIQ